MRAELEPLRQASRPALEALRHQLAGYGRVLIAFSGGVDSTFLLAVAREVLGDGALALTAHSASVPELERVEARALAARLGARHIEVVSREMDVPAYTANTDQRCYFCKRELYQRCREVATREGISAIADGYNADDQRDHRPGHRAAGEAEVFSPLAVAGLGKPAIRAWSEAFGLPTWDKPQMACLASRIPYGTAVTPERLAQVERAEAAVRALGLRSFRVRHHGEVGRLEVAEEELAGAFAIREALAAAVKQAGFRSAALDLEPFRSGRMNELAGIPLPVVTS
jgi:pyridinium-3,5-biscarboxylic acid mononucleotide sulfurtransferase